MTMEYVWNIRRVLKIIWSFIGWLLLSECDSFSCKQELLKSYSCFYQSAFCFYYIQCLTSNNWSRPEKDIQTRAVQTAPMERLCRDWQNSPMYCAPQISPSHLPLCTSYQIDFDTLHLNNTVVEHACSFSLWY